MLTRSGPSFMSSNNSNVRYIDDSDLSPRSDMPSTAYEEPLAAYLVPSDVRMATTNGSLNVSHSDIGQQSFLANKSGMPTTGVSAVNGKQKDAGS